MLYIENNSTDPFFNFALEYYLLTEKQLNEDVIFLFWRTEPTLMIGRYQNTLEEINQQYVDMKNINVVRRITGGGTIYTDLNGWEFSFITKNSENREIDFKVYTQPIIEALREQGVNAYFNDRNDLLIDGKKFSGNAQCKKNGHILHHGSILFNTNIEEMVKSLTVGEDKIISKGIKSVKERVTNVADHLKKPMDVKAFKEMMVGSILKEKDTIYTLSVDDIVRIKEIAKERFLSWHWNYGESPAFNITKANRFMGGKIEFKLEIDQGKIQKCAIYGDFFSDNEVGEVSEALCGCEYRKEAILYKLNLINAEKYFYKIKNEEILKCIIG